MYLILFIVHQSEGKKPLRVAGGTEGDCEHDKQTRAQALVEQREERESIGQGLLAGN